MLLPPDFALLSTLRGKGRRLFLPLLVLVGGFCLSGWLFFAFQRDRDTLDRVHFHELADDIERSIVARMAGYEEALRGGVGLFSASDRVESAEWTAYVS